MTAAGVFALTKFQPPPARDQHVVRADLLERASGMLGGTHLLVTAGAGAGKSTFAAQWAQGIDHVAWVSLSDEDNEPGRFWSAVIGGLQTVVPGLGERELGALAGGGELNTILLRLLVEIGAAGQAIALVLDDLHLIDDPDCMAGIDLLLNYAPPNLRVALCSRTTPPLELTRLIAHGVVMVVDGQDLLLATGEAEEFLRDRLQLDLADDDIAAIMARTEGWAAGVYMAALSIRFGHSATAAPGGDRRTRSYLTSEVFESAPPHRRVFLEGVSVLERFSAPMVDDILGRTDSAAIIDELVQDNLFVIPLDGSGTWFRLHHLFAELLRERVDARGGLRELFARAADWHIRQEEYPEAIMALIRAEDFTRAGELIAAHYVRALTRSRLGAELARWLDHLPDALVRSTPPLCLCHAWLAGGTGRTGEMEVWLERATAHPWEGPLPDGTASVEAQIEVVRGVFAFADHGVVLKHMRRAAELDGPESPWWSMIQWVSGFAEWLRGGDIEHALAAVQRAQAAIKGPADAISAAVTPGLEAVLQAELGATRFARDALKRAEAIRTAFPVLEQVPHVAVSWWTSSRARLLLGDVDGAARDAEIAAAHAADIPPNRDSTLLIPPSLIALARARIAQGRREEARPLLLEARERLSHSTDPGRYVDWVQESLAELSPKLAKVDGVEDLSERELEVLLRFDGEQSLPEIAAELFVSPNTVKSHAKSIYRKLNVASRAEAVQRARDLGVLS